MPRSHLRKSRLPRRRLQKKLPRKKHLHQSRLLKSRQQTSHRPMNLRRRRLFNAWPSLSLSLSQKLHRQRRSLFKVIMILLLTI